MNNEIKITIPINPITKKNSQRIYVNRATGKPFIAPSEKFKEYEKTAGIFIKRFKIPFDMPVNVKCLFYMPTRRRVDLTNLLEAIDDILVYYGVISDDDYSHIGGHDGSRVFYDKANPRTEIIITPLETGAGHDKI